MIHTDTSYFGRLTFTFTGTHFFLLSPPFRLQRSSPSLSSPFLIIAASDWLASTFALVRALVSPPVLRHTCAGTITLKF